MAAPVQGGPLVNVPIRRTVRCLHVIPANDTKGSRPPNNPRRRRGSNPGPLAPEAGVLTTEVPRFLIGLILLVFCPSFYYIYFIIFYHRFGVV